MLYRIVKWIAWSILVFCLFYAGTALLLFCHTMTTTVCDTPWGKVDTDTAKVGFMEYWNHEPCYEVYKELVDGDTVRYYFFKSRAIYYKAEHDGTHQIVIRLYYPNSKVKDGEICTKYFRKEDIFIR